ncbi:MAG: tetratricopeptide repeat protein [Bacteroidota bacterium]
MKYLVLLVALCMCLGCKKKEQTTDKLGVVSIEVNGNKNALIHFEKGLLLLHSFEYQDAREAFEKALEEDPDMPMAHWGKAMTFNHSLWSEQDFEDGVAALAPLEDIDLESRASELERDLIEAARILYQPKTAKKERDKAYSRFLGKLTKKHPGNHEILSFYALSLLGASEDGRDPKLYTQGAEIAQRVLDANPSHPGALHYLIHSYDDPDHATLALNAANAYAKVAPDASHALHMPSHIYVAMGMWDEVISSNINSYQASLNRMERKKLDNDARGYHAFHWLQYGLLQKGDTEAAKKMVFEMEEFASEKPSPRARVHVVFLKGTYLIESDDWDENIANIEVDVADLNLTVRSQYQFLEGMKAYRQASVKQLDSIVAAMENDWQKASFVAANDNAKLCSGATRGDVTNSDIVEAQIRQQQLMALRANLDKDVATTENHLLKAIELESTISYSYGPPHVQKPPRELYADWLLEQGRTEEAKEQYTRSLETGPKRRLALRGIDTATQI